MTDELARLYPAIKVDPQPIWVQDGNIYTSAGVSSGIDLSLALLAEDLGEEFAMNVARILVLFLRRPGGQAQFSQSIQSQAASSKVLQDLLVWIAENLHADLTLNALADRAAVSRRTLIRLFNDELNISPAKYLEAVRLEAAKCHIELGAASLQSVATRTGFNSVDVMRRTFVRHIGITPAQYAQRFKRS
jgi:transcriptional regulator GlxA family with amidase domain